MNILKRAKVILFIGLINLLLSQVYSQNNKWIDFNKNGKMDVFEDPYATIDNRVNDLLDRMTVDEQILLMREVSPAIPRLGIPKYDMGNEALHGVVRPGTFTVFPQAIGLAATWNPDLIYKVSTAISDEARARWNELEQGKLQKRKFSDLLVFWSPTVNMARDPRWGRTPETYGEDPYLTSRIGVSFVKGLQGNNSKYLKVVSTPKHFAGNNEEHNRFMCQMNVSERNLRNYYLPAFKALITEGKSESIMTAYNAINGIPCTANHWLLKDILRGEWGFNGYIVTDCGAPGLLLTGHKYVKDEVEAAAATLNAGVDLECGGYCKRCLINTDFLPVALDIGLVTKSQIRSAAFHILRARFKLGIFDDPSLNPYSRISPNIIGSKEHRNLALEAALQSIVLLKNEKGILPINLDKVKKIAVLGNNAAVAVLGDYSGNPCYTPISPLDGIRKRVGKEVKIYHCPWVYKNPPYDVIEEFYFTSPLKVDYYSDTTFTNKVASEKHRNILFEPDNQAPNPLVPTLPMSVRWQGELKAPLNGEYLLGIESNATVRVYLDGEKIIDARKGSSYNEKNIKLNLKKKTYKLVYEYSSNDQTTLTRARLRWKVPNQKSLSYSHEQKVAGKSDLVIAVMGINQSIEKEGVDRRDIYLPKEQEDFLKEIYQVNPNMVVVLVAGNSLGINWINDHIPAVVNAWYPGEQGGNAIAEVLFGDYNPAGRLPLTFYKKTTDLPAFNDYDVTKGRTYMYFKGEPLYPFGYGLSYTKFDYSSVQASSTELKQRQPVEIKVDVQNSGKVPGDEVAQLYVRKKYTTDSKQPIMKLCDFKRIHLNPGEKQKVCFLVDTDKISYWNDNNHYKYDLGEYEFLVGASSKDIRQKVVLKVNE